MSALLALTPGADAQQRSVFEILGTVHDQSGAVLPGATVDLIAPSGAILQSTTTDGAGAFRFDGVASGPAVLRARFEGFKPSETRVRVGPRPPAPQRLTLNLAALTQEITVSNAPQVDTTAASNLDAVSVDQNMLESLPVLDQDYIGTISRFLDAGSIGTNGVTLVVNGMEVNALRVSASAVQQIKINQDPYSAEFSRPGRGRIEILTKPGGQEYHGEANVLVRDARFDARNAFAATKPPEHKHIFEGVLSGPVGAGGETSFLLSASDQLDDQQAIVFALGPAGAIQDTAPQANRQSLLSGSITRQLSDRTTVSVRPSYEYESSQNRGVGGTTLASAGTDFEHREEQLVYNQQSVFSPALLNQFQILVGHEREPTTSVSAAQGIVVAGAFTGGGAQGDLLRTETHLQLMESVAWTHGHHLVQAGFQLPDWSRRGFYDHTNEAGTFYFADLSHYRLGQPDTFIIQRGNGDLAFLEKQVGAYVKDDWQMKPGLTASLGLRYDWQNYFHDDNNIVPRVSLAYAPGNRKTDVIRAGVGLFNDRSGPVVIADLLHSQPGGLTKIVIENPASPNPTSAQSESVAPRSIVQLAPDVQIPQTLQYSAGFDHQLRPSTTLSVTYTGSRGYHLFRSRDINAPPPPLYSERPNAAYGVVREIESNGRQQTDSLAVTVRGRLAKWFNGQTQYTLSRAYNDTSGIAAYPANDYDLVDEWARADFDRRHRLLLLGRLSARDWLDVGVGLTMNSGGPFTETLGGDVYNNGRSNARPPGVPRNSLEAPGFASVDLRLSRDIKLAGANHDDRVVTFAVDAFNLLNRVNDAAFVGTLGSPLFGFPVSARPPRQVQFSVRTKF